MSDPNIHPEDINNESDAISSDELNPENNPMRVSGSKYLSKNATKAVLCVVLLAFGIIISALMGDELFGDKKQQKEDNQQKAVISDNSMNAAIINGMAGQESIIPANTNNSGIIGEEHIDNGEAQVTSNTPTGTRIQTFNENNFNNVSSLPPNPNYSAHNESNKQKIMEREKERLSIRQSKIQMFTSSVISPSKIAVKYEQTGKNTFSNTGNSELDNNQNIDYAHQERNRIQQQLASVNDPNGDFQQKINSMRNGNTYQPTEQTSVKFSITPDTANNESGDKWTLNSSVKTPNKLSLITGFVIPATLITGVNSDLPGKLIAQVSQNVYDTPTGRFLLIPQGTKIFGTYDSGVIYGQERVLVSWNRLIFPDGKNIDIGSMDGSDEAGYSGMNDLVNNHYLRLFTSSFLLSVISAGVTYSQDKNTSNNENGTTASSAMAQSFGNQMGNTAIQMIQKNMNISPTLEIRPGFKINVMITKDIIFSKPYQNYDY